MIKLTRIAETCLYVSDLERSVQFYSRLFGLPILHRDARFCALAISEDEVLLLFLRGASREATQTPGGLIPAHDGSGELHVCFGIAAEDIRSCEQALAACGTAVEGRVNWPSGAKSLYFRDPDNHAVELSTPGVWSRGKA